MTVAELSPAVPGSTEATERFRLSRAGVLNVWQYDEQVFTFADGRLLLRGANGAGKSKTLEMLLPFALDGDKARITASAKHHTSLLWLMTDGLDSGNRVGYVWVEFQRTTAPGSVETFTCGVGIRASTSARSATAWHFVTDRRIGTDLTLEDDAGPLSMPRLKEVLGQENVFERAAEYKAQVGRRLFGLDPAQYDEVLRLLYWLRQPQIGEDIEPAKLAQQLSQALPQLDEQAVRAAGETFDELTAFGEQIQRRSAAAEALGALANAYRGYARSVVAARARTVVNALRRERSLRSDVSGARTALERTQNERAQTEQEQQQAEGRVAATGASLVALRESPEYRDQRRLFELKERAEHDARQAEVQSDRHRRQSDVVQRRRDGAQRRRSEVNEGFADYGRLLSDLDARLRRAVPESRLPGLIAPAIDSDDDLRRSLLEAFLDQAVIATSSAAAAVRRRLAQVEVVRQALAEVSHAQSKQTQAEHQAAQAEARWERARGERLAAEQTAIGEETALSQRLRAWVSATDAPAIDLPESLTDELVDGLPRLARDAAEPRLVDLQQRRARSVAEHERASAEVERLTEERRAVEAEHDPAPPPPQLPRTQRPDGLALWQVLDFAEGVDHEVAANLEAALQASGLLDAWVRPGGRLLGASDLDVVLAVGEKADLGSSTLARYLVPDLPVDSGLDADGIRRVLSAVGSGDDGRASAWVAADGSWRLGPAHGRARKDVAQFIGATARAHERARRLALLDAEIAAQLQIADAADEQRATLDAALDSLRQWVAALPSGQPLLRSRIQADACRATELREESSNREAQEVAHASRMATAQARSSLERAAAEHELPVEAAALDAANEQLRGLVDALRECEPKVERLRIALDRWLDAVVELDSARESLAVDDTARAEAERLATVSFAAYESLRASIGDTVELIQQKIDDAQRALESHRDAQRAASDRLRSLLESEGTGKEALRTAHERLEEQLAERARLIDSLAAVSRVPGLLDAAAPDLDDIGLLAALAGHPASEPVSRPVRTLLERLSDVSADEASGATTRVWRAHADASNGPAGDHQPVVAEFGDLLAITGRDDAGESAIVALAARVAASVARDSDLLSEREKQQFEQHVLGELGDAIRQRRRDADELVVAMNVQLGHVSTSQGIRVRLDWKLRDDVPAQVRAAVQLLAQPVGALVPEERETLRDVLHHLIEASRSEHPDLSYGEHLAAALDYRSWSEFTIRYTRPERPGQWDRLHRRSPLSQGEQKVLCYLPLFAAAAAHFTSLAGAAPHAPRLVLLDDAFPKIDARTHPLLFGLLVQLDLDFVVTSERLWGDHSTVPSLAIYEALRDPIQRGIAQYEYRWDGRVLQGIG